ncbi:zinc knuckle CX2CX4HX4C containing protein [Tanacetum coccineum]
MADEFFDSPSVIKSKSIAQPPTNPIIVTIEENVNGHLREIALNATLKGKVFEVLKNWHERSIQVIMVTDGEHLCLWSRMSNTCDKGTTFGDGAARVGMQIRSSPKFISRKWSMDTRLLKEELTRIPIWVKLHDVPIQGFEEDGISLIATFIGYKVRVDSRGDVVTIGIPSLSEDDFTKGISMLMVSPPIVATSNVVTPNAEKTNDGFQTVGKKKKRKGKSKSTNGGQFTGPSVKHNVRYEPKATTSAPKKGDTTYMGLYISIVIYVEDDW